MRKFLFLWALILPLLGCGSGGSSKPPMTIDQVAGELNKVFATASDPAKSLAQAIGRLVERKQYAPASIQLQTLISDPTLTKAQRGVAASAMATVNNAMQAQVAIQEKATEPATKQPAGPPPDLSGGAAPETSAAEAKATLEYYKRNK